MRRLHGLKVDLEDGAEVVGPQGGFKGVDESCRGENEWKWPQMALSFCTLFPDPVKISGSGHLLQIVEHSLLKKSFSSTSSV